MADSHTTHPVCGYVGNKNTLVKIKDRLLFCLNVNPKIVCDMRFEGLKVSSELKVSISALVMKEKSIHSSFSILL